MLDPDLERFWTNISVHNVGHFSGRAGAPVSAPLRELEHQSPVKHKPAVVPNSPSRALVSEVEVNSPVKAMAGASSSSSQSEQRAPSPEFLPDNAQASDISGGRILFGSGLSPTKAPAQPVAPRLQSPEDDETEDDIDAEEAEETVIRRAHATIQPGGGKTGKKGRRRKRY